MNFDKLFETDVTRNGQRKNEKWEEDRRWIMGFLIWLGFKARFKHQENFSGCSSLRVFGLTGVYTHKSNRGHLKYLDP